MEYIYYCVTCTNFRHDGRGGKILLPEELRWCALHERQLPQSAVSKTPICNRYNTVYPQVGSEMQGIASFPEGVLWDISGYGPVTKLAVLSELPKVDATSGATSREDRRPLR